MAKDLNKVKNARHVAIEINEMATRADRVEAYNTELYVRIPGIGLRNVRSVGLDDDAFVVLDLSLSKTDRSRIKGLDRG